MVKRRKSVAGQTIADALAANPKIASRTLARKLYSEYHTLWPTQNACLNAIRAQRGALGKRNRNKVQYEKRPQEDIDACQRWGAVLPDADEGEWRWYDLPEEPGCYLVLSDIHSPYHDKQALASTLAYTEGRCDGVLILGDGPDCYQISSWERDPRKRDFAKELVTWGQILDALAMLKPKKFLWKLGNHDYRLERYLIRKAPELVGLRSVPPRGPSDSAPDAISWASLMCLEQRGIQLIPANCPIQHHELSLIHGHEWGNRFSSPVNPARGAFLKAHDCVIEGHGHRTSHHVEHTLRERPISCWSLGCLCTLHPEYRPLGTKWNHGFATLTTGSQWKVENHRIINGEVV